MASPERWHDVVLKGGPYCGTPAECFGALPEHIRVWTCSECRTVHMVEEASRSSCERPGSAARYALVSSSEDPALYVYDGVGGGGPQSTYEQTSGPARIIRRDRDREPVPA